MQHFLHIVLFTDGSLQKLKLHYEIKLEYHPSKKVRFSRSHILCKKNIYFCRKDGIKTFYVSDEKNIILRKKIAISGTNI